MFSSQISQKSLALLCRSLSMMLNSGIDARKTFQLAATKTQDGKCRRAMEAVRECIDKGDLISEAMRRQDGAFPDLMVDMMHVAEETGSLPEILKSLAEHYENNLKLRKHFLGMIAWPVIQFVLAVFIIALVILILGWLADTGRGAKIDPLGLNLVGVGGALVWLTCTFGSVLAVFVLYQVIARSVSGKRMLDPLLMKIPVLGKCMRSFAIARFSWCLYLTQQTGMPIQNSLQASLRATANGAFQGASGLICQLVESGDDLSTALAASRLFPEEFLQMVMVAETSGTVPEALHRLSPQFEEDARRAMSTLAGALGVLVWVVVAAFILFFVFSIVLWYAGMLNEAADEALRG